MKNVPLTRRRFLEASAVAGAAVACAGAPVTALAEGGQIGAAARPVSQQVNTVCPACPNGCSFTAYVVDGQLGKVIGNGTDPQAAGTLCARGYGCTQSVFSDARVKNPLRKKADGSFQTISWDEALAEIAEDTIAIVEGAGAEAVAMIYDGLSSTASAYGPRFMDAIGSANAFVDDVTLNVNKEAAFMQVIGTGSYVPDVAHAKLVVLLDTSYADIATPGLVAKLQAARQSGTPIIAIDSRLGTLASFADEWVGVNPGTELALLLAVCNTMIRNNRYDQAFIEQNVSGFDAWAASIDGCTSLWAEGITGVDSWRIDELASRIVEAAPSVAIEYGNGRVGAGTFSNSSETARCVCLLNALAGAWNAKGGALMPFDLSAADFTKAVGKVPGATDAQPAGMGPTFPLGAKVGASAANALRLVRTGTIRVLFSLDADIAYDYASIAGLADTLENMDLFVCFAHEMTETALLADYVLPVSSYLESASLPLFSSTEVASVAVSSPVLTSSEGTALPMDAAVAALADACGLRDAFAFSLDEAAAAQLAAVGLELEGLKGNGSAELSGPSVKRVSGWQTPTGKIQCVSAACQDAGLPASPVWVPTLEQSTIQAVVSDDENLGQENSVSILTSGGFDGRPTFHLITGQQTVVGYEGYDTAELTSIADTYGLDEMWINAQIAQALGIETGDEVWVGNDQAVAHVRAFVTQRIVPTAVYLPAGFGRTSYKQSNAHDVGVNPIRFSDGVIEGGYGTLCTQEACVWLWKEGE